MITAKELDIFKAQEQFQQMCGFLKQALAEGQRVDQVERGLFPQAMSMCLDFLRSFVVAHGELEGAQAMLSLRAVHLNGLWDQFIAYRTNTEQSRLYGENAQHATAV